MSAAGTPWSRSYATRNHHPKTLALAKAIKRTRHEALGILDDLFASVTLYWPDGNLAGVPDLDIERTCGWHGVKGRLTAGLAAEGWLDGDAGQRRVHNWSCYMGSYRRAIIQQKYRDKKKAEAPEEGPALRNASGGVTLKGEECIQQQQQQETTYPPVLDHEAAKVVVDDLISGPIPADHPPTMVDAHMAAEAPVTKQTEEQAPERRLESKPAARATLGARASQVGDDVTYVVDYRAWVASLGWRQGKDSEDNENKLKELLSTGPIPATELAAIVPVVTDGTPTPNGGFALGKLLQARVSGRQPQPRSVAANSPTAADEQRNHENAELAKTANRPEQARRATELLRGLAAALGA